MSSDIAAQGLVLVPLFVALALVVIVPLGLRLLSPDDDSRTAVLIGLISASSFLLPAGWTAGALTLPWLLFSALQAAKALLWAAAFGFHGAAGVSAAVAPAFLTFGAGWLSLSRLGVSPMGFGEPIVLLTAMHFHYAGFAVSTMAALVLRELPARRVPWAAPTAAAIVSGPVLLALGWAFWPPLKPAGAVSLAAGAVALAWLMLGLAETARVGAGRWLLRVSAASIPVGMSFALAYAFGEWTGQTWVDMPRMAAYHGTLNGVGFCLCGLLGLERKA